MAKSISIFLALIFINCNSVTNPIDGTYSGLEKLCWSTDENGNCVNTIEQDPGFNWYHENTIKVKGDSVFLDQNPLSISIKDHKKIFSASDGGFYYYKGTITQKGNLYYFNFKQLYCDYCPEEIIKQPDGTYKKGEKEITKQLIGKIVKGKLVIEGNIYAKIKQKHPMRGEVVKPQ
jgi:hypothetical protein